MNDNEFSEPVVGDRYPAEDAQRKRLIVVPLEYVAEMKVRGNETTDAIRINVVDLESGTAYYGALWFGGRLVGAFKSGIGNKFVGYIDKERTGQGYMAWTFYSLTQNQEAVALARSWLAAHPEFMERAHDFARPAAAPGYGNGGAVPPDRAGQPPQPPAWATGAPSAPAPPPAPAWTQADPAHAVAPAPANPPAAAPKPAWMNPPADGPQPTPAQASTVMDRLRAQALAGPPTSAPPAGTPPTHEEAPF